MKIRIHVEQYGDDPTIEGGVEVVEADDRALHLVRYDFNPSDLGDVGLLKALAAALITATENCGQDGRLTAMANSEFEIGAMLAVKSATARPQPQGYDPQS